MNERKLTNKPLYVFTSLPDNFVVSATVSVFSVSVPVQQILYRKTTQ